MSQTHKNKEEDESGLWLMCKGLFYLLRFLWKLSIQLLFFPFKGLLTHTLDLEQYAAYWPRWGWLYLSIKWVCAWGFLTTAFPVLGHLLAPKASVIPITEVVWCVSFAFLCALVFNILEWIGQYARDPDIQRRLAGIAAEDYVQTLIENSRSDFPQVQTLHGQLFVFNAGMKDEFSVEADHIVMTQRSIFVIETKCKSGTISAKPDAPKWTVTTNYGMSEMRNALKQAKNAARVLQRQVNLPVDVIPLVAIKGNEVEIVNGPSNVVAAENLVAIMQAFEQSRPNPTLDPEAISALLRNYISHDQSALEKHIARAQAAKHRTDQADLVKNASIQ